MERGLPNVTTIYAATGTVYHEVIAECLELGLDPYDYIEQEFVVGPYTITFDEEFAKHMTAAIERVRALAEDRTLLVETRVDISPYTLPGQFGTSDVGIVSIAERFFIVYDHKYGEGQPIHAFENYQLLLYALGLWHDVVERMFLESLDATDYDPHEIKVRLVIDQPRARVHDPDEEDVLDMEQDNDGSYSAPEVYTEWEITVAELLEWGEFFKKRAEATQDPDAPFTPSDKACFFCKAKKQCRARTQHFLAQARMGFDALDESRELGTVLVPASARVLTIEERVVIAKNRGALLQWVREIYDSVLDDYMRGYPTPGAKAIRGRKGPRKWANEKDIEKRLTEKLGEGAYEKKLISPPKLEEQLTKEEWGELIEPDSDITQSDGKPSLVDETDKRPAIVTTRDGFELLEEE